MSKKRNVTFVGLGTMGYPMAGHLSRSELFNVSVFNRTSEKSAQWGEAYEGRVALTIEDAVKDADVVITCTGRDEDMMEIVFSDDGMMPYLKKGSIFIDHTTTSFKLAKHLNESLKDKNISFIDAPVSGGEAGAINGVLSVMAGGDAHILDACDSIIKTYSKSITLMGDSGSGQLAKMVNQICIAGLLQGLSEGLLFAESENLNMDKLLSAISGGAAQSWQMVNRGKTMHQREFDFGFAIKWMVKDLGYCLDQADGNNTKLTFTQEVYDRYTNLMDKGHTYSDTSALMMFDELNK
ncbi:2-hydroxy-3-oxopropionate reductase [Candidatus Pseudothioglobus singularis]|jgi:3-hydroxyisobutyrate dehydrogenase|uniref:Oxidoreductase n=1 Tax=Candidatus Pseudothioglobus singularis PS1 TaxID=1125411 RepID=A0A0M5L014_9GAMM|nr:NAD(P)-dependent oxidoreductase [Candidatus Pseudothioglobus singularis]ALE01260.1 oxidoreductase [Candidatus Pseudothioglobus singularis PS1]ANQ65909.1 2-hydroxy-3-oxopropionate reductase [Candidatus Pseudothioglobus singularis]MDA7448221.1 NAD(P)-dependent oxidoreductase [Candidatus Pseudothioglobus singularis]MDB0021431.1 NAD(P)-dependent oxidoreductase [Candidatus Pseudothioglobus singularis]MDB4822026.1 NAD(P)-dependent oxidoreductase [Candidatus Pseudothioglobus singularis]